MLGAGGVEHWYEEGTAADPKGKEKASSVGATVNVQGLGFRVTLLLLLLYPDNLLPL